MDQLHALVNKAKTSSFYMWVLNQALLRTVPFNGPHKIKVESISDDHTLRMYAPYVKNNKNHIKGIHACLLATLCEYVSGLSMLINLSPKEYRIILKNINMTYHYQAKSEVYVEFKLSQEIIEKEILEPLKQQEAIYKEFPVEVYDSQKNHICTGLINWQIKAWKNVKLKVN